MVDLLILGIAAVSILLPAVLIIARWPQIGFACIGVVAALSWEIPIWPPLAYVLGLSVSLPDMLCAALFLAALVTAADTGTTDAASRMLRTCIQILGVILLAAVIRGLWTNGLGSSLNEGRPWIYIFAISFWVCRVLVAHKRSQRWLQNWILGTALLVLLVALLNVVRYGLGGASTAVRSTTGEILEAGRPVSSGQAVILAAGALIALYLWRETRKGKFLVIALACAATVVVVQHRSVWIAFLCAGLVAAFTLRSANRVLLVFFIASGFLVYVIGASAGWLGRIPELLASSASDSATYEGRVYDWVVLIRQNVLSGPESILFGQPSGSGWWRYREDGLKIGYIPHNWYVATYLRAGIIGLAAMVGVGVLAANRLFRLQRNGPGLAICALIIVYCWAYNLQWYLAPLLALVIAGGYVRTPIDSTDESKADPDGAAVGVNA